MKLDDVEGHEIRSLWRVSQRLRKLSSTITKLQGWRTDIPIILVAINLPHAELMSGGVIVLKRI